MLQRFIFLLLFSACLPLKAQTYRYLILLKDKGSNNYSLNKPEAFLSSKSLERRRKNRVVLTSQDLPISQSYLDQIKATGASILFPLKWINGALITQKPSDLKKTLALSCVKGLYWNFPADSSQAKQILSGTQSSAVSPDYGNSSYQINQLGIDQMHAKNILGQGSLITLLDDGFKQANTVSYLQNTFSEKRIIATLITDPTVTSIYTAGGHGTNVLSTIAGYEPGKLIGTTYKASFALAQTEESGHELIVEEANWLRGAEWADSLGTDIISSSLGYSTFDNPLHNHSYADMNGKSTLVSKAAGWAASKGILVTISAGNEGANSWKYITAPADADSILTVGSVTALGNKSSFSSIGPSFDGRIKPDVVAMGSSTVVGYTDGMIGISNGTSFSAPLIAGLAAGLLQTFPRHTAQQIRNALLKSGTQFAKTDMLLGFGIPNYDKAIAAMELILENEPDASKLIIYPNPVSSGSAIHISMPYANAEVELLNNIGAVVHTFRLNQSESTIYLAPFISGKYYFRFTTQSTSIVKPILLL
ncbi:S8 family serine peptidase [Aquirufa sp. A-Brett2-W8]